MRGTDEEEQEVGPEPTAGVVTRVAQVCWSITQFYTVGFSQSNIIVQKGFLQAHNQTLCQSI